MNTNTLIGILIPFIGTTAGAACVIFMKNDIKPLLQKILLGFASGVMVAASVWSLLIPAMEMSEPMGKLAFVPAAVGFAAGIGFLLLMDRIIPHLHIDNGAPEGVKSSLSRTTMLVLAVTLHNIPEGMAVGVVFAGAMSGNSNITLAGALALSIGIAIQNFPEGAIISMPLKSEGKSRGRSFIYSGAHRGASHDPAGIPDRAGSSLSAGICRWGHDICGGGRTDTGSLTGRAFQHRYHRLCGRIYSDDDS